MPLQKSFKEAGVGQDQALVDAAQQVLQLVQPQQVAQGMYNAQIGTAYGTVIGDHAKVEQRFGKD